MYYLTLWGLTLQLFLSIVLVNCNFYISWFGKINSYDGDETYDGANNENLMTVWEGQPFQIGFNINGTLTRFLDPPGFPTEFNGNLADVSISHFSIDPRQRTISHNFISLYGYSTQNDWSIVKTNVRAKPRLILPDNWQNLINPSYHPQECPTSVNTSLLPDHTHASAYINFPMGMPAFPLENLYAGLWLVGLNYGYESTICLNNSYQRYYLIVLPRRMHWFLGPSLKFSYTYENQAILKKGFVHENRCLSSPTPFSSIPSTTTQPIAHPNQHYTLLQSKENATLFWVGEPAALRNCSDPNISISSDPLSSVNATTHYQICSYTSITGQKNLTCSVPCTPHNDFFPELEFLLNGILIASEKVSYCSPIVNNPLNATSPVYAGEISGFVTVNFDTNSHQNNLGFTKLWRLECRSFLRNISLNKIPKSERCANRSGEICLAHTIIDIIEVHNKRDSDQCRDGAVPIYLSNPGASLTSTFSTAPSSDPLVLLGGIPIIVFACIIIIIILVGFVLRYRLKYNMNIFKLKSSHLHGPIILSIKMEAEMLVQDATPDASASPLSQPVDFLYHKLSMSSPMNNPIDVSTPPTDEQSCFSMINLHPCALYLPSCNEELKLSMISDKPPDAVDHECLDTDPPVGNTSANSDPKFLSDNDRAYKEKLL